MYLDFLYAIFREADGREAIIHGDLSVTYSQLLGHCEEAAEWLERQEVTGGMVVALRADYSVRAIALFLALAQRRAIVLQAGQASGRKLADLVEIGEAEAVLTVEEQGEPVLERTGRTATHALYEGLRQEGHPGLVLFSSGSTGAMKGTVHDLARLLGKYHRRRHDLRTLTFLLFDHIGGIDTLFYCLSNGSAIIVPTQRDPAAVCQTVARHRVEVLPAAPTFLNMLYFSREYEKHDLSSLRWVTYGAEVMPEQTLKYCREMFPSARLLQKYGASEIGTPRSQSKDDESLWMKLGGEGFAWRIVDGLLEIKAASAMLGYLNAPSPFTEDGWFRTGDAVEVDGEYLRILGRGADLINVGGKKVYPAEVEAAIRELPDVVEVTVYGEPNALMGQVVAAKVWPVAGITEGTLRAAIRKHVLGRLEAFKVPTRITFQYDTAYATERFKKLRRENPEG